MSEAQKGNRVLVQYTGKFDDGTVFDTSSGREPLQFTIGENQVIPGFENAVTGMSPGDEKTVTISSEQAYGPRMEELVLQVPKEQIPPDINPEKGQQLQIKQDNGQVAMVTVTDVTDTVVTLDANHPLAGKDLTFDIRLVEVN